MAEEIERIYVIPLKKTGFKSSRAAPVAIKRVKDYLMRHMKVEKKDIWIDDSLNDAIWKRGKFRIPSKIRVKAVKFEDGVVEAYLPEFEFKKSRRELLKEEREKKEPILRKEEAEEAGEAAGAEEYDIKPTADGEVKIKKKKAPRAKKEEAAEKKPKAEKAESEEKKEEKAKKTKTTKKKAASKTTKKKSTSKKKTAGKKSK